MSKKTYETLSNAEAQSVFASKPNLTGMQTLATVPNSFSATSILMDAREWPNLSAVLLLKPEPGKVFSFTEATRDFNNRVMSKVPGKIVKELTVGEYRKGALAATRKRLADANKVLTVDASNSAAKDQRDEALAILKQHGWTESPAVRRTKKKAKAKAGKTTNQNGTVEHTSAPVPTSAPIPGTIPAPISAPVPAPVAPAPSSVSAPVAAPVDVPTIVKAIPAPKAVVKPIKPNEDAKIEPPEKAPAPKPVTAEPQCYYVTGNTKPVKDDLKKLGGHYDGKKIKWWFPSVEFQTKGQKIVDDFQAGAR